MAYLPRNSSGRSQAKDPIAALDIANKEYVDTSLSNATMQQYFEEVLCSAQSLANNTATALTSLTNKNLIGTSAFNLSTGVWTAPANDFYTFTVFAAFTAWVNGSDGLIQVFDSVNGLTYVTNETAINNGAHAMSASGTVYLAQGTQIVFRVRQTTGSAQTIDTSSNPSYISVVRGTPSVTAAGLSYNPDPIGTIKMYGGATAPNGYLLCDGSAVSTTTYANLFAVIGYSFGGSGTTFNLPGFHDATGRFPRAQTPGSTGGSLSHNHTLSSSGQADMALTGSAAITRQVTSSSWTATNQVTTGTVGSTTTSTSGLALSGTTDTTTTTAPYVGVTFIIKYQ